MRTVTYKRLVGFDGEELENAPCMRDTLTGLLARYDCDATRAAAVWSLGIKIHGSGNSVVLENAEYDLLSTAVKQNGTRYVAIVLAQILDVLESAEEQPAIAS